MSTAITFYFNDIFPDYTSWKDTMITTGVVNYFDEKESKFDNYCYNLLINHYTHCNIRYSTPEAFICELVNVYANKFKQFKREKSIIDALEQLDINDLIVVNTSLANLSRTANTEHIEPGKILDYISEQTYNKVERNKLDAYLDALERVPSFRIYKFFKANSSYEMGFDDLFMQVLPAVDFIFEKER